MWFKHEQQKDEQEVRLGKLARFWAKIKKRCLLALIGMLALAGVYVAGILTAVIGPRHFGNFHFDVWPGEIAEVVRLNQEFTKPWFGLGEAKSRHWLYVKRLEWKGDFPFLASGDELALKPGDYVMRESRTGQFIKLDWTPKSRSRQVAAITDFPLPPPPKALVEAVDKVGQAISELLPLELSPADRQRQTEYAAKDPKDKRRWGDSVKDVVSRFHPVLAEVPDEEPRAIYEGVPVKTAVPAKTIVSKRRR